MFIHFTVNTYTDREWGDGSEDPRIFDPARLDARQWARIARGAGFRSLILTAKHHDGFCLWPTRTTAHSVRSSPWRAGGGDLVREFTDACRAEGLGAGLYLSPWDRNAPSYGQGQAYDDFYLAQLEELLGQYGPLVEVLNVPPTRDGLFHDRDVQALEGFGARRTALFERDLLRGGRVRASGGSTPAAVVGPGGEPWRAPAGSTTGWLEVELPAPVSFDTLRLEEAIELGQHVANHRVDVWRAGRWHTAAWGTTIGHARLHACAPTMASRIRVVVEFAYEAPALRRIAAYQSPSA